MARLFSFATWNVEHFKNDRDRIQDNIQFVRDSNPDVFAIFEVEGRDVFGAFVELMPNHNFFITEDLSRMEILVGVSRGFTAFVTQRQRFKSNVPTLRPGALVTLVIDNNYYSLLFLHLKSSSDPRSWGLRDDMIHHVRNLKKALDRASGAPGGANFICIGDLNTMGMNLTYSKKDVSGEEELKRYLKILKNNGMRLLPKDVDHTHWGGIGSTYPKSNLDHALASEGLTFKKFGEAEISVRGWPQLPAEQAQTEWIQKHSDHALLYGEVHS
ncbi:MAG: endonuclease/exonuclease/phosphatase family protein [Anaerolineae bacterium]